MKFSKSTRAWKTLSYIAKDSYPLVRGGFFENEVMSECGNLEGVREIMVQ